MQTRPPFVKAFLHPLNLGALFLAIASGLCSAWWMFPVGLLVWAVMFILVLRQPGLQLSHVVEARGSLAQRFQARFDRIERVQIAFFNSLSTTSQANKDALAPIRAEIDRITEQSYQLCKRVTALENLRMVDNMKKARQETDIAELERKIDEATDAEVREDYEDARRSLQNRLDRMEQITVFLDRVEAQLASLASTLDSVHTEAVRLQAISPQGVREGVPELMRMIHEQEEQLTIFHMQVSSF
jgi:hypothetical protein